MQDLFDQVSDIQILNHLWLTLVMLISMILISRTVVAGTRYSSILIIVIFGLAMGHILVKSGVSTPGLEGFPIVILISKTTITALIVSFFVGGQELKKLISKKSLKIEDMITQSEVEVVLGTKSTQFVFIVRAFFILLGLEGAYRLIKGTASTDVLDSSYLILSYIGIVASIILIDYKAKINNKQQYMGKGLIEIVTILFILISSNQIAQWVKPVIGLPQIFFAMIISAALGMLLSNWQFGPTIRSLLFAGIPVVLAGNFLVGGSRIGEAFNISGMTSVMLYGFFGQVFWMFTGLAILIYLGRANHVRNLAPGMAGSLSHSGLTGACTAGDLGSEAESRAPIMINIPFFGHVFVFSILAASAARGKLIFTFAVLIVFIGIVITVIAVKILKKAHDRDDIEIKGLMVFSFGWQLVAVFGSFLFLSLFGMPLENVSMAVSAALSHFGLFAAVQGGMFGANAAGLIAFIFAMPFLVHPLVFGMFGKAVSNNGKMPEKIVYILAFIGMIGVGYSVFML